MSGRDGGGGRGAEVVPRPHSTSCCPENGAQFLARLGALHTVAGRSAMYLLTSLINKTDTVNETEYIAHGDAPLSLNEASCAH